MNPKKEGTGKLGRPKNESKKVSSKKDSWGYDEFKNITQKHIRKWRNEGYPEFAENYFWIRPKKSGKIKIKYNLTQRIIINIKLRCIKDNEPIRIIILKSRQKGASTESVLDIFNQTMLREGYRAMIVSYDVSSSDEIFKMMNLAYDCLPDPLKVTQVRSSMKAIEFVTSSGASTKTAKDENLGSSFTIQAAHLSEVAKWKQDPKTAYDAISQAIPFLPSTRLVVESTAKGKGNFFHQLWEDAKKGKNGLIPIFIPWFIDTDCILEFKSKFQASEFFETINDKEIRDHFKHIYKMYGGMWTGPDGNQYEGVTLEKLNWYYNICFKRLCSSKLDTLRQEYPSSDTEAFVASSESIFDVKQLERLQKEIDIKSLSDKRKKGFLKRSMKDNKVVFEENKDGYWTIVEQPNPKLNYMITCDVAEGIEDGDFHNADVTCREKFSQVAQLNTRSIDPDELAEELAKASDYYNECWIIPERNKDGNSVIRYIQKKPKTSGYKKEYLHRIYKEIEWDKKEEGKKVNKYGWLTTTLTRPLMINELIKIMNENDGEGSYTFSMKETLEEMITFVKDYSGKPCADTGCHDDRVMTAAISCIMHSRIPFNPHIEKQKEADGAKRISRLQKRDKKSYKEAYELS